MSEISDQVEHVISALQRLTNTVRSSWGSGYNIKKSERDRVKAAQDEVQMEINGLDPLSLSTEDQIRLRQAKEKHLIRTNPAIEQERRMAGGREE